jgi:predicted SnoaL-like aldol condensation-catalyzing enzyme
MKTGIGLGLVSLFAVVGVKDPESLFMSSDAKLNRNKQAALHIERELLQCGQWDRAGEWLTDAYHQHNPNAASGLKGVVVFFTQVMKVKKTDNCGALTAPVVAVIAEGDYVTVMTATKETDDPNNPGKKYNTTWFDTWRFVDGKADEHWDPATITPRPAAAK